MASNIESETTGPTEKAVESGPDSSDILANRMQDLHLSSKPLPLSDEEDLGACVLEKPSKGKGKDMGPENKIRHTVYDMPDQSAAENIISQFQDQVEHENIRCDGPLCKQTSTYIKGLRYKCTVCDNVDFCLSCIASFHNNHDVRHGMVKCLLPTRFKMIREIDDNTKRELVRSSADPSLAVEDVSHVVCAETQKQRRLQDRSLEDSLQEQPSLGLPVEDSRPTVFVIARSKSHGPVSRKTSILEYGDLDHKDSVATYKIDEAGNIRVHIQPIGGPPTAVREEGLIMHHQDANLMVKVLTKQIRNFRYDADGNFHRLARQGRLVTRVVDVKPGNFDDKMDISIRVVDLAQGPKYEALSYTWKETAYERAHYSRWTKEVDETFRKMAKYDHAIYCRDELDRESYLVVSAGLRDALRRLRDKSETKTYWIDQLSINQKNPSERAFQVSGMRYIYNQAQQVTVWTGDEDKDTLCTFEVFHKVAQASRVLGCIPKPEELTEDVNLDLPPLDSPIWKSLMKFFSRPVFGRCWVIQEIVLGQKVIVRCGEHTITWEDLSTAAYILSDGPWLQLTRDVEDRKQTPASSDGANSEASTSRKRDHGPPRSVIMIKGFREDFQSLREISFESLLYNTGVFGATDPRDKVYSLLGLRSAKINPSLSGEVQPDYQKSVADVYTEATRAVISMGSSLNICGINDSLSSKKIEGLPSWVPDYSSTSISCVTSFSRPDPSNPYCASGDTELIAVWPYEERKDLLLTSSYKAETILTIAQNVLSETGPWGALVEEWTRLASDGPEYVTGEFTPDVFWRTCIGDSTPRWRQSPAPLSYHHALSVFFGRQFLHHVMSELGPEDSQMGEPIDGSRVSALANPVIATLIKDAEAFTPNWLTESPSNIDPEAVGAFRLNCGGRKFFRTTNNYFGIGPVDSRVGDEVHILSGTRVPFVLRKVDASDDRRIFSVAEDDADFKLYTMIGETYVHGIMKGEALSREDLEWSGIYIR